MSLGRALRAGRPLHVLMAAGVGVSSGYYLFAQPLREYWAKQEAERGPATRTGRVDRP
jgi:hypothetical protein